MEFVREPDPRRPGLHQGARSSPTTLLSAVVAAIVVAGLVAYLVARRASCGRAAPEPEARSREVVAFIADSLDLCFSRIKKQFEAANPDIELIFEPSGSVLAGRKVSSGRRCDLLAVADDRVITDLMPGHASWHLDFCRNEIVIAGTQMSRYINEIDGSNWYEVLLRDDVSFGRADPRDDPCGYWTLLCWKLADRHYPATAGGGTIYERLIKKMPAEGTYVRSDSHQLMSLVETTGGIDYGFVYRSQAVDHGLRVVELPAEVNLSDPGQEALYRSVSIDVPGKDGKARRVTGKSIVYAITVLDRCRDLDAATKFVRYVLDAPGNKVLVDSGFPPISPARLTELPSAKAPDFGDLVAKGTEQ